MTLESNTILQGGKYRIIRVLGQGGFGITYEAEQVALKRIVAIKEFYMKDYCDRDASTNEITVGTGSQRELVEKFRSKFIREAQMIAEMTNAHIVHIIEVFEENSTAYYVMEYLPGGSLAELVNREGALSESKATAYICQIAEALSYIHSRKTVHLDIKPSNILINSKGEAILIDFGISKHIDLSNEQTISAVSGYSNGYAPIEQVKGSNFSQLSPATDIYALGATLFFLLSGQAPPDAVTIYENGLKRIPGISNHFWKAITSSMQPKQSSRPQTISDFISLLPRDVTTKHSAIPIAVTILAIGLLCVGGWFLIKGHFSNTITIGLDNGHEWVDLGLSVKWATCNVGANSISDVGELFAWGEKDTKREFHDVNYSFWKSGSTATFSADMSKYATTDTSKAYDNKSALELIDDAAHENWGGHWRMPTEEEFEELSSGCTWEWQCVDGTWGCLGTSMKNGQTIFLTASGWSLGSDGAYWTSDLYDKYSDNLSISFRFDKNRKSPSSFPLARSLGLSIRPVTDIDHSDKKVRAVPSGSIEINCKPFGSFVWIDNEYKGVTPLSLSSLKTGTHKIDVSKEGYSTLTRSISIEDQKLIHLSETLILDTRQYVDLGLSVKWATCNIGAAIPSDEGLLFAWGETTIKDSYKWENYMHLSEYLAVNEYNIQRIIFSKYNSQQEYGGVDEKTVLDITDDAAHVLWGSHWRMPKVEDYEELLNNCSYSIGYSSGYEGIVFTSRRNSKSIFFPYTGYRMGALYHPYERGMNYWTSTCNMRFTYYALTFSLYDNIPKTHEQVRYIGFPIRPVFED